MLGSRRAPRGRRRVVAARRGAPRASRDRERGCAPQPRDPRLARRRVARRVRRAHRGSLPACGAFAGAAAARGPVGRAAPARAQDSSPPSAAPPDGPSARVDPMEADARRPMSAYGVIDPTPVMRDESAEPPSDARATSEGPEEPAETPASPARREPPRWGIFLRASGSRRISRSRADAQAGGRRSRRRCERSRGDEARGRATRHAGGAGDDDAKRRSKRRTPANAAASTPRGSAGRRRRVEGPRGRPASSAADPLAAARRRRDASDPDRSSVSPATPPRRAPPPPRRRRPRGAAADARAPPDRALSQSLNAAGGVSNALDQFRPRVAASGEAVLTGVGTCDFTLCDVNAGPQYVDSVCTVDGGLGCKTDGCRFCLTDNDPNVDPNLPRCPPCVCAEMGRTGARQCAHARHTRADRARPPPRPPPLPPRPLRRRLPGGRRPVGNRPTSPSPRGSPRGRPPRLPPPPRRRPSTASRGC